MSETAQILVPTAGTAPAGRPRLAAGEDASLAANAAASQIAFIDLLNSSLILPLAENNKGESLTARTDSAAPEARFEAARERPQRSEVEPPSRQERDAAPLRAERRSPVGERAVPESDRPAAPTPENRNARSERAAACEREPARPLKAPVLAPTPNGNPATDAEARVRVAAARASGAGLLQVTAQQRAVAAPEGQVRPQSEGQARQEPEGQLRAIPGPEVPRHAQPTRAPAEMKSLFAETAPRPAAEMKSLFAETAPRPAAEMKSLFAETAPRPVAEDAGLRGQVQRLVIAQQESVARQATADKVAQPQAPAMSSKGGGGSAPQGGGDSSRSNFMAAAAQQASTQGSVAQAKVSSAAKGFAQIATAARVAQGTVTAQSGSTAGAAEGARMPTRPASEAGSAQKAAPAREPAQAEKLLRQVIKATKITISRGREEVRMLLKPESLGWLKVRIAVEGQKVTARIVVENQGVRDLLETNVRQLHQALQNQNLKVSQIVVDLQGDGGSQLRESGGGNGSEADPDRSPATEDTAPDAEAGWPAADETGDSLVDLRV